MTRRHRFPSSHRGSLRREGALDQSPLKLSQKEETPYYPKCDSCCFSQMCRQLYALFSQDRKGFLYNVFCLLVSPSRLGGKKKNLLVFAYLDPNIVTVKLSNTGCLINVHGMKVPSSCVCRQEWLF